MSKEDYSQMDGKSSQDQICACLDLIDKILTKDSQTNQAPKTEKLLTQIDFDRLSVVIAHTRNLLPRLEEGQEMDSVVDMLTVNQKYKVLERLNGVFTDLRLQTVDCLGDDIQT